MTQIDYCITTMERPHALERLLLSVAAHRPEASIHVADQSESFDPASYERLAERLEETGLRKRPAVHRLPFDCGVSAARNHLVDSTPGEYKLIVDDDGVFTDQTDVDVMARLLDALPDVGAVGGSVIRSGQMSNAGSRLQRQGTTLRQLAVDGPFDEHEGTRFTQIDCLPNCALMRRELFSHVRWDPALKTAAEHFDFYLRMRETPFVAIYTPDVTVEHPPVEVDTSYRELRWRGEFLKQMLTKHGLLRLEALNGTVFELDLDGDLVRDRG